MAEDRDFEVIDKRRVKADGTAAEEMPGATDRGGPEHGGAQAGAEASGSGTGGGISMEELRAAVEEAAAQAGEGGGAEMPPLDVPGVLSVCVNMLNEVAWMRMGLIPSPM